MNICEVKTIESKPGEILRKLKQGLVRESNSGNFENKNREVKNCENLRYRRGICDSLETQFKNASRESKTMKS